MLSINNHNSNKTTWWSIISVLARADFDVAYTGLMELVGEVLQH
jgi:hypothetical protein